MVDIQQHIVFPFWRCDQFHTKQRLFAHDVKRTAKAVIGILSEVCFRHLTLDDGQLFRLIYILTWLAVVIDEESYAQLRPFGKNRLNGLFHTVKVNIISQFSDTRNIVLHHLRKLQAVIEHA